MLFPRKIIGKASKILSYYCRRSHGNKNDKEGAIKAFNEAIRNAHGQAPNQIHTDALRAYNLFKTKGVHYALQG